MVLASGKDVSIFTYTFVHSGELLLSMHFTNYNHCCLLWVTLCTLAGGGGCIT